MEQIQLSADIPYQKLLGHISQIYTEGGKVKAGYGKALLANLSRDLTRLHSRGFSRSNLVYMRLLYLRYPISQKLSDLLSWSHLRQIAALDDAIKRDFYIESGIHVSEYLTVLPSREVLQIKLHRSIEIARQCLLQDKEKA